MSKLMQSIREKAKAADRHIVLPESGDERVTLAAAAILREKLCRVTLIGDPKQIRVKGAAVVDPADKSAVKIYSELLYNLRKDKGMTPEEAERLCKNPLYLGALLVKAGRADGMVAGSVSATGDVLRPALQIIKTAPGISIVSSCFLMVMPEGCKYGENGILAFADCAVNINPNAEQLAAIAIASAASARKIAGVDPKVAMLSFSTKGSAKHEFADKVIEAAKTVKQLAPELSVDGELQADAALVESVGKLKSPGSAVAGRANVLIFPDLQSGNISYKLVQRLAGAEAIGPICQGFNKPVNDLSRGCSVEDVVNVAAITALQ